MKNGKKLTRSQRDVLLQNGVKNTEDYLYVKTTTKSGDGRKSLNQKADKVQWMVFLNVKTGLLEFY